jgi:F-box interacting protein
MGQVQQVIGPCLEHVTMTDILLKEPKQGWFCTKVTSTAYSFSLGENINSAVESQSAMSQPRRKPKLSSEFIPDDVVFDILIRFPVKSLIRFRCVSKSYNSTITSPIFITKHLNLNQANNHNGYLLYSIDPISRPPLDRLSDREICAVVCNSDFTLTEISRFQIPFTHADMIGFCNGIFCFYNYRDYTIYLWNPSIKKSKMLATTTPTFKTRVLVHHGLAYHSQNNDFKILRIVVSYCRRPSDGKIVVLPEASVYTLSTDSWRRVVIPEGSLTRYFYKIPESPFIFLNGALHSIAYTVLGDCFILCFDVNDERFREIMLPANTLHRFKSQLKQLVVFKGSLALVVFVKGLDGESVICHIWMMTEYGVVESWTRRIVPVNFFPSFVGSTDNDELLIEKQDGWLVSFDPDSLNENSLGIQKPRWLRYTTDFIESLVLVDGENQD